MRFFSGLGALLSIVLVLSGCAISGKDGAPDPVDSPPAKTGEGSEGTAGASDLRLPAELVPGRSVAVTASNLEPQQNYLVVQCLQDALDGQNILSEVCDLSRPVQVRVQSDDQGTVSSEYTPRAAIGVGERTEVNCLETACVLALTNAADRVSLAAAIRWRKDVEMPRRPRLVLESLKPRAGSIWGTVSVAGSGYAPRSRVELVQCPARGPGVSVDTADCLYDTTGGFKADASGSFTGQMQVAFKFQRSDGDLIDCEITPETCALAVPFPNGYGVRMSRALFSAAKAPGP